METLNGHRWSGRTLFRYTLLQIPGLAALLLVLVILRRWAELSPLLCFGVVAAWIIKDAVLFPFVWRAYETSPHGDRLSMIGEKGVAEEPLNPSGYARFRGELWKAEVEEGHPPVVKGAPLRVREMHGLKLVVVTDRRDTGEADPGQGEKM